MESARRACLRASLFLSFVCGGIALTAPAQLAPPHRARPNVARQLALQMREGEPSAAVVATLAAAWAATLFGGPAAAVEAADDLVYVEQASGIAPWQQFTALAVTAFAILPTPGMLGLGGGGDVSKQAKGGQAGFKTVDDVIKAARDASVGGPDRRDS